MANKCVFVGNLTKDPTAPRPAGDSTVVSFGLAVNRRGKTKKVMFIDCSAFNQLGDIIYKYLKSGSKVYLEGELEFDIWEDKETGAKRSKHQLLVNEMEMLDKKEGGGESEPAQETEAPSSKKNSKKQPY